MKNQLKKYGLILLMLLGIGQSYAQEECWLDDLAGIMQGSSHEPFRSFITNDDNGFIKFKELYDSVGANTIRNNSDILNLYARVPDAVKDKMSDFAGGQAVRFTRDFGNLLPSQSRNLDADFVDGWKRLDDLGVDDVARRNLENIVQSSIINKYAHNIASASQSRKGNFGEVGADLDLNIKGYESLQIRINNINAPGHNGIDGVYRAPDGSYIIVEAKYGSAKLESANPSTGLPRQMSDDWIERPGELANAIGNQQLAQTILNSDYKRVLARVAPDGTVTYRLIDEEGYVIMGGIGNFNP
ncbi:hypothetical protein U6A24_02550 [Aquimarina gracilis]|uniref:EndoU nuclease-like protein n=1 Tax=Aquimarina gracilis TaxID=874422 RepID=A0ABU5ZQH1_9FLAO|nr:hypothetical protein [Aquimarina gracilis]MEB3344320.1 hypothetical protein [Aquimarina gracilis]